MITRQLTDWKKNFAHYSSGKVLISQMYKALTELCARKKIQLHQKWGQDMNKHFFNDEIQIAIKYIIKCSISLIIREMDIKTIRYHLILQSLHTLKRKITSLGMDVRK